MAISLVATFGFWLQTLDFLGVLREFGFPTALAIAMFLYFRGILSKKDSALDHYREETLIEQRNQTEYLKKLLAEARATTACRFEK